jgi:hypothetical protein
MVEVICDEVSTGLRADEAAVSVRSVDGRLEWIRVPWNYLTRQGEHWYLPVGLVYDDRIQPHVLVEFTHEADTGANRVWVKRTDLLAPRSNGA